MERDNKYENANPYINIIVVIIASALGFLAYSSFLRNNYVVSNEVPYGGGMMGGMMGGYRGGMFYHPFIIAIPSLILGLVGVFNK
jgi:uncharacterized membrane protein